MALSPATSRASTFNGGTITTKLEIAPTATGDLTLWVAAPDSVASSVDVFEITAAGNSLMGVDSEGNIDIRFQAVGTQMKLKTKAGATGRPIDVRDSALVTRFALLPLGAPVVRQTTIPADGDLVANEMAVWFDATNGAGKLMVKAKTADGTVVTGSLALA